MIKFDFLTYMENVARKLKDIAHTDDNRRFFRISGIAGIEEYLNELPDVNGTSLMVVENPEGNISDNRGNNFTDEPDFEFYVTKKYTYGDADERSKAKNDCKIIGQKIIAKMLKDKADRVNGLDLLQLSRVPYFCVGPFGDSAIAVYFKFNVIQSANLVYNVNDWNE